MRLVPENHPTSAVGFASGHALREWNAAVSGVPELMARELDRLKLRPLDRGQNPRRTHPLRPPLDKKTIGAVALPLWQQEITKEGRRLASAIDGSDSSDGGQHSFQRHLGPGGRLGVDGDAVTHFAGD